MQMNLKNNKGFSLIDSLFTTVIIALALISGLLALQNVSANAIEKDMQSIASQLANEKLEIIMADNEYRGYNYLTESHYATETLTQSYNMTRSVSITEVNAEDLTTAESGSGAKKVAVSVVWGDEPGQTTTITTLLVDYQ